MITRSLTGTFLQGGYVKAEAYAYSVPKLLSLMEGSRRVETLVAHTFGTLTTDALVGKPVMSKGTGKVTITVPYYLAQEATALNHNSINALGQQLAIDLGCPVELRLIRLQAPYLDAHILAQYLSAELATTTFLKAMSMLMTLVGPTTTAGMPGSIMGIKVQLRGRLMLEPSRPRMTAQSASLGTFTMLDHRALQSSSYTVSNDKGAYTVKVWLAVKA